MSKRSAPLLLFGVIFLLALGVVMLISTCAFSDAAASSGDVYHNVKRQVVWLALGVVICVGAAMLDYHVWQKYVWWIYGVIALLLALCYVPGIGVEVRQEKRWIGLGFLGLSSIQLQPSELAKIGVAIFLAHWFAMRPDCGKHPLQGFLYPMVMVGILIALVLFEQDIGTSLVLCASVFALLFVAGVDWRYLATMVAAGVAGILGLLHYRPDKMERIYALLDLEKYRLEEGFQQWIAMMALGSGGTEGLGLGSGRLKMLYMPFAHTDFIFPMIGEELGVVFTLLVVFAFVLIAVAGIAIAFHAKDRFGSLLAVGLVGFLVFQGALNIGVTTAVLPNTGLPLPFVSYGGTALLSAMAAVGILLNIYREGRAEDIEDRFWMKSQRYTPRV